MLQKLKTSSTYSILSSLMLTQFECKHKYGRSKPDTIASAELFLETWS